METLRNYQPLQQYPTDKQPASYSNIHSLQLPSEDSHQSETKLDHILERIRDHILAA